MPDRLVDITVLPEFLKVEGMMTVWGWTNPSVLCGRDRGSDDQRWCDDDHPCHEDLN
jgi:hypothetical protein